MWSSVIMMENPDVSTPPLTGRFHLRKSCPSSALIVLLGGTSLHIADNPDIEKKDVNKDLLLLLICRIFFGPSDYGLAYHLAASLVMFNSSTASAAMCDKIIP